jgi:alpha galactosidase A-like protein/alpha-galactosidase-like CBM13-containing protein/alpha galactosidase C-like protein
MLRGAVVSRQFSLGRAFGFAAAMALAASDLTVSAFAENNGVSLTPQLAWSSWSFVRRGPTEAIIKAQAQAMHQNLQSAGFQYINLDDFWYLDPRATVDAYGRWVPDPTTFPDGMAALAAYIHSLGLKFGMYVTPGIPVAAVNANTAIEGTRYTAKDIADVSQYEINYNFGNVNYYIDYSKPGAQAFIDSWAKLFASWGVDYIKIDGVGTWDVPDVIAWSQALNKSGRKIHLALSNSLSLSAATTWPAYANSWRITGDVEYYHNSVYPLTSWSNVLNHFQSMSQWTAFSGPGGWPDPDSLEIGNGPLDGINSDGSNFTENQRQTLFSWWCVTAAPLILGTDLTSNIDSYDYSLLHNGEVIAIDQAGVQAAPVVDYLNTDPGGSQTETWRAKEADNSFTILVSNPSASTQTGTTAWPSFGIPGPVLVRDLWGGANLIGTPNQDGGYQISGPLAYNLAAYQSQLLKVTPMAPVTQYLVDGPNSKLLGSAVYAHANSCSDGTKAGYIGNGGSVVFGNVYAAKAGTYNLSILYFTDPARPGTISVNNGAPVTVSFPSTGSFSTLGAITQPVLLNAGYNTITISGSGSSYAPDIDSITVPTTTTQYLADAAQFTGKGVSVVVSPEGTDGKKLTVGPGGNYTVTFNVSAVSSGPHSVLILYLSGVPASASVKASSSKPVAVNFPSSSGDPSNSNVVGVANVNLDLLEGANTITISSVSKKAAPDLDSIIVAE